MMLTFVSSAANSSSEIVTQTFVQYSKKKFIISKKSRPASLNELLSLSIETSTDAPSSSNADLISSGVMMFSRHRNSSEAMKYDGFVSGAAPCYPIIYLISNSP